jgi:hypothetical protein
VPAAPVPNRHILSDGSDKKQRSASAKEQNLLVSLSYSDREIPSHISTGRRQMAAQPGQQELPGGSGFGKRGNVRLTPAQAPACLSSSSPSVNARSETMANLRIALSGIPNPVKWAGGGLMAFAVMAMLSAGTGGGGLLGGLLGGMLAHRLMSNPSSPPITSSPSSPHAAASSAASNTAVARGGFGSTASGTAGS